MERETAHAGATTAAGTTPAAIAMLALGVVVVVAVDPGLLVKVRGAHSLQFETLTRRARRRRRRAAAPG